MKKKVRRSSEAGFTLLELMFASGVVAMALGMLFGSLVSINIMGKAAEGRTHAVAAMSTVLEQARRMPLDNLFSSTYSPLTTAERYDLKAKTGYDIAVSMQVMPANGGPAINLPLGGGVAAPNFPVAFRVHATVVWTTPQGHVYSIESTTMRGATIS